MSLSNLSQGHQSLKYPESSLSILHLPLSAPLKRPLYLCLRRGLPGSHFLSPIASPSVVSSVSCFRSVPPPLLEPSPIRSLETLPTTSLLLSVTESTPSSLTPSLHPASPQSPPSPSIRGSLWAPKTDDTYESSIIAASPLVQFISFPKPQESSRRICSNCMRSCWSHPYRRVSHKRDDCLELYSESLAEPLCNSNRTSFWSNLLYSISQSFAFFAIAPVFWYGSQLVLYREFTLKQFFHCPHGE